MQQRLLKHITANFIIFKSYVGLEGNFFFPQMDTFYDIRIRHKFTNEWELRGGFFFIAVEPGIWRWHRLNV